jgi:acrylyl-CoA reductase (NADPH)
MMTLKFRSLMVEKAEHTCSTRIKEIGIDELHQGNVLVKVAYSSVNYKDALATLQNGNVARTYPLIPGVDFAGTVVSSKDPRFKEGDEVISAAPEIGVSHHGGFCEYARVSSNWLVPVPKELSMKQAMIIGTAGFTSALSVHRLEENGLNPEKGPVIVTGATGGVGSLAVAILAKRNYHVAASTGKESEYEFLRYLGANEILKREELTPASIRPLEKQRWSAAIDPVGGKTLSYLISSIKYGGSIALSGLTGGSELHSTVFPFILRGISLLGINKDCSLDLSELIWNRLADDFYVGKILDEIYDEVTLDELPQVFSEILQGQIKGRTIVRF